MGMMLKTNYKNVVCFNQAQVPNAFACLLNTKHMINYHKKNLKIHHFISHLTKKNYKKKVATFCPSMITLCRFIVRFIIVFFLFSRLKEQR